MMESMVEDVRVACGAVGAAIAANYDASARLDDSLRRGTVRAKYWCRDSSVAADQRVGPVVKCLHDHVLATAKALETQVSLCRVWGEQLQAAGIYLLDVLDASGDVSALDLAYVPACVEPLLNAAASLERRTWSAVPSNPWVPGWTTACSADPEPLVTSWRSIDVLLVSLAPVLPAPPTGPHLAQEAQRAFVSRRSVSQLSAVPREPIHGLSSVKTATTRRKKERPMGSLVTEEKGVVVLGPGDGMCVRSPPVTVEFRFYEHIVVRFHWQTPHPYSSDADGAHVVLQVFLPSAAPLELLNVENPAEDEASAASFIGTLRVLPGGCGAAHALLALKQRWFPPEGEEASKDLYYNRPPKRFGETHGEPYVSEPLTSTLLHRVPLGAESRTLIIAVLFQGHEVFRGPLHVGWRVWLPHRANKPQTHREALKPGDILPLTGFQRRCWTPASRLVEPKRYTRTRCGEFDMGTFAPPGSTRLCVTVTACDSDVEVAAMQLHYVGGVVTSFIAHFTGGRVWWLVSNVMGQYAMSVAVHPQFGLDASQLS